VRHSITRCEQQVKQRSRIYIANTDRPRNPKHVLGRDILRWREAYVVLLRWQGAHLVEETRLYVRRVLLVRKTGLDGGLQLMILEGVL
jgi:hypothetical protein